MKNRIRVERAEVRMTQQQLADAVGVSRQTVNAVETGKFVPSTLLALKIARTAHSGDTKRPPLPMRFGRGVLSGFFAFPYVTPVETACTPCAAARPIPRNVTAAGKKSPVRRRAPARRRSHRPR